MTAGGLKVLAERGEGYDVGRLEVEQAPFTAEEAKALPPPGLAITRQAFTVSKWDLFHCDSGGEWGAQRGKGCVVRGTHAKMPVLKPWKQSSTSSAAVASNTWLWVALSLSTASKRE